jgi:hypothetical protein
MANLTYNRAGRALRFDLSDPEIVIIDAIVSARGLPVIENQLNELFREYVQRKRDREISQIQEKLATLTDTQRQAIVTILNS